MRTLPWTHDGKVLHRPHSASKRATKSPCMVGEGAPVGEVPASLPLLQCSTHSRSLACLLPFHASQRRLPPLPSTWPSSPRSHSLDLDGELSSIWKMPNTGAVFYLRRTLATPQLEVANPAPPSVGCGHGAIFCFQFLSENPSFPDIPRGRLPRSDAASRGALPRWFTQRRRLRQKRLGSVAAVTSLRRAFVHSSPPNPAKGHT